MNNGRSSSDILRKKLIEFSISIIKLTKVLPTTLENKIVSKQIIRSSSSIGANYSEGVYAHGKADFIHCLVICRKKASETLYWLELLLNTNPQIKIVNDLLEENKALLKIFVSSVKTARYNIENEK